MAVETSIIIRTLNEARYLENLLQGIHDQNYHDWEIILVDSGSTDHTLAIAERYGARIYHIPQEEFTFGGSLNRGCREARGRYLVFASGHVWPTNNNWLLNLVKPFEEAKVAMVYGRQRGTDNSRLAQLRDQQNFFGRNSMLLLDEPLGHNGNSAVRHELWRNQPFNESIPALEDMHWSRNIQRKGYRVYYSADAAVYHVHHENLKQIYRRSLIEATAYNQMFPSSRFPLTTAVKAILYHIAGDLLFALRQRKVGKLLQIPSSRMAQFLGTYKGFRYQKRLNRDLVPRLQIPETYRSVVMEGPGRHSLKLSRMSALKPDDVLIQVAYAGVCGIDLEVDNAPAERDEQAAIQYPIVPGHEYSGIVLKSGSQVTHLRKGQRVSGGFNVGCGYCAACAAGDYNRCVRNQEAGETDVNGAYADYLITPSRGLHKLPSDFPLKYGTLLESVSGCLEGLRKLAPEPGRRVCVVGAGPIGNLCAQILKARGLHVTVVDDNSRWVSLLYKYEMDTLADLGTLEKFDYLIEANGDPKVVAHLLDKSNSQTKLLLIGPPCTRRVEPPPGGAQPHNKLVWSSGAGRLEDWKEAIRLVQKEIINLDDHIAAVKTLEAYTKAWEEVKSGEQFKVLLKASEALGEL